MTADRIPFDADRYFAEPERWGVETEDGSSAIVSRINDTTFWYFPNFPKSKPGLIGQKKFMYKK